MSQEDRLPIATRIIGWLLLLVLFGGWLYFSWVMVSLALDYPIRRAGESAEFPVRGTPRFYTNCTYQVLRLLSLTWFYWIIPAVLAFWLPIPLFPRLRGWRYWIIGISCVLLPPIVWSIYNLWESSTWGAAP
jgi:hypothetical protein